MRGKEGEQGLLSRQHAVRKVGDEEEASPLDDDLYDELNSLNSALESH